MGFFNWLFGPKTKVKEKTKAMSEARNIPLTKYYAFNETGNIMVSTTNEGTEVINDNLKLMFMDMSIFFVAMTKAIVSRVDEDGKQISSIYNSNDITTILDESENFVEVKQEHIKVSSSEVGHKMSKELTEKLLGRQFDEHRLNFSRGLFSSICKGSGQNEGNGSIFFICESIMGLPMVSAVVIKLNSASGKGTYIDQRKAGDIKERKMIEILEMQEEEGTNTIMREWEFDKNTYYFISPRSVSNVNFPSLEDSMVYEELVKTFKSYLKQK